MQLQAYIDLGLEITGNDIRQVGDRIVEASKELEHTITVDLGCELALDKGGVVASTMKLASYIAKRLGTKLPNTKGPTQTALDI